STDMKNAYQLDKINLIETKDLDSAKTYKTLVEKAADIMCRLDESGNFIYINDYTEELLGVQGGDILGTCYSNYVNEFYRYEISELVKNNIEKELGDCYLELPIKRKGKQDLWVGLKIRLDRNSENDLRQYWIVGRNISKQKLYEQKIKTQNKVLEIKNDEIQRSYNNLLEARMGKRALGIVLLIAVVLFILTEAFLEPKVEQYSDNQYAGLFLKGVIALLLKPIDTLIERWLIRRALKS
ncbi:MAG: PAS domain-containing protein, partial [Bacteroidota bacterium]